MRIFLTGATGFIGGHLAPRLVQAGHQLVCLARPTSQTEGLRAWGVEVVTGDVTDPQAVRAGMAGCQAAVHLAGTYAMWQPDANEFFRVNVGGMQCVMAAALESGLQRVVNVSTAAVYGRPAERPFDEDSRPGPHWMSAYARSKAAADQIAWEAAGNGLGLTALYPGIVLGAGDDKPSGQYIQDLIRKRCPSTIYHHSIAMYVAVQDVVTAIERSLALPQAIGQKYLLGSAALTGRQFADLVSAASGVALPLLRLPDWMVTAAAYLLTWRSDHLTHRPPPWGLAVDAAHTLHTGFYFDGSRAERELGFHYTPIQQALDEAVASYREAWSAPR